MEKDLKVFFEPNIFTDLILAALVCKVEVSGFARVQKEGDTYSVYGEPVIYKQYCSAGHTVFDTESHGLWIQDMIRAGKGNELTQFRVWWHSHGDLPVYLSGMDRYTIDVTFAEDLDWLLAVVVNKQKHIYVELNIFRPERRSIPILDFSFTEQFSRKDFEELMANRRSRMEDMISSCVKYRMPSK